MKTHPLEASTPSPRPRPMRDAPIHDSSFTDSEFQFGPAAVLVRPDGPGIDARQASKIVATVREELANRRHPVKRLLVDLNHVLIPSSMAIGMILELSRLANRADATCHLTVQTRFREVLQMLRLDDRYTMEPSGRRLEDLLR